MPSYPPLESFLMFPQALWGAALFIPLILFYLFKPKPKHIIFSSIMFIRHIEKTKRFSHALRRFVSDPLLLIQMIIIVLLLVSIADPYFRRMEVVKEKESVIIVLDGSASMKATDVPPSRFSEAINSARKALEPLSEDDSVAVVLVEKIPMLVLKEGKKADAQEVLSRITASDSPGSLGDAIYFARDLLSAVNSSKKIYVFSDFSHQEGMEPAAARNIAEREGIEVEFVKIVKSHENNGINSIIAHRMPKEKTRAYVSFTVTKYGDSTEHVKANIKIDNKTFDSITKELKPGHSDLYSREFSISFREQLIEVELDDEDDLGTDDRVYAILPEIRSYSILLISNDYIGGDRFIRYALGSISNVRLFDAAPPVTPSASEHDTIILGNFDVDSILPGTYNDLKSFVSEGGAIIVTASNQLSQITDPSFHELLPVNFGGLVSRESYVTRKLNHEVVDEREVVFENTIVKRYFKVSPKNDTVVLAEASDGTPLIAYRSFGRGRVFYIGLSSDPEWSNFYYTSAYPIFWSRLVDWINVVEKELKSSSLSAGDYLPKIGGSVLVTTPSGKSINSSNILLDEVGIYAINHESGVELLTVNLVNFRESNITSLLEEDAETVDSGEFSIEEHEEEVTKELFAYVVAFGVLFLLFEAFYLKWRGYYEFY